MYAVCMHIMYVLLCDVRLYALSEVINRRRLPYDLPKIASLICLQHVGLKHMNVFLIDVYVE